MTGPTTTDQDLASTHRERTYFPALALVQLAWDGDLVLIDPTAVDITRLQRLFHADIDAVFHAAQQDLDVLTHAVGAVPEHFVDTQIAGAFLGYGTASLSALLKGEMKIDLPKGDRLTDWFRRPLTDAQRRYAALDVAYLLELADRLDAKLAQVGRQSWAAEACDELASRPVSGHDPDQAWLKLKDVRRLGSERRAIAQAVAAWRERTAAKRDVPVRQVLPDLAILGISQRRPSTLRELGQARGVDDRFRSGKIAEEILAAVAAGKMASPPERPQGGDELARDLRPAVTLISAWVSQVAKAEKIDTAILATRADLVAFLSGAPDARLAHGWRADLLGAGIRRLVSGEAGLTFTPGNGLRLVDISSPA
ncbi:MAG: hypothetical protein CSA55_01545 [Ilumatobacter coccineus]|uniref:HRDC domain-containing protein n=1 Tax=Ilumatobacter coccineus TaxID=467094 RepID=A0A2G6KEB3_9ACTN|nr:MAG: hypothetical protein CSA55_01545 [Ilumatobacter coccineus]